MNNLFIYLIVWVVTHGPLDRTKRVNDALEWAERSYSTKNYPSAIRKFRYLTDSLQVTDVNVKLNLSHALFNNHDTLNAKLQYERLDSTPDKSIASVAMQQLGVLAGERNELDKALSYFKQTLKTDPANEQARYNYELLKKKKASEQQKQPPPEQKKEQQQQEQQKQEEEQKKAEEKKKQMQSQQDEAQKAEDQKQEEKKAKQDEKGEEKETKDEKEKNKEGESKERRMNQEQLKEINISEEKARTILDAMKNSEVQYLQQKKRTKTEGTRSDKKGQDW